MVVLPKSEIELKMFWVVFTKMEIGLKTVWVAFPELETGLVMILEREEMLSRKTGQHLKNYFSFASSVISTLFNALETGQAPLVSVACF